MNLKLKVCQRDLLFNANEGAGVNGTRVRTNRTNVQGTLTLHDDVGKGMVEMSIKPIVILFLLRGHQMSIRVRCFK